MDVSAVLPHPIGRANRRSAFPRNARRRFAAGASTSANARSAFWYSWSDRLRENDDARADQGAAPVLRKNLVRPR